MPNLRKKSVTITAVARHSHKGNGDCSGEIAMNEQSKIAKELERLKRQIRERKKSLDETAKKAEDLDASIQAEMRRSTRIKRGNR